MIARAFVSETDNSSSPGVAGMRLGGRNCEARIVFVSSPISKPDDAERALFELNLIDTVFSSLKVMMLVLVRTTKNSG